MNHEIRLRIILADPPPGILFALQRGKDELAAAERSDGTDLSFELTVQVKGTPGVHDPDFGGGFVQGRRAERFIYVNSGIRAGDESSCWERRAKIPLSGITWQMVDQALSLPGASLEGRVPGKSGDGGPVCAGVTLIGGGWSLVSGG